MSEGKEEGSKKKEKKLQRRRKNKKEQGLQKEASNSGEEGWEGSISLNHTKPLVYKPRRGLNPYLWSLRSF